MPVALLAEGVDRNLLQPACCGDPAASPSSRRAWIEISVTSTAQKNGQVALLAEGVDRNVLVHVQYLVRQVALLAEGVDRNKHRNHERITAVNVALLAEGVDRNQILVTQQIY